MTAAPRLAPEPLLSFENVTCRRGDRILWRDISFSVSPGDALHLEGPNGCGKSSLLRVAAGLLEPFAGLVNRTARQALADEGLALDRDMPLRAAIDFWRKLDGQPDAVTDAALKTFGLHHLADVPVRILSTGQRKRATLARVQASGAAMWLLDEPSNGLDQDSLALLDAAITTHRARGGAVLYASHQRLAIADARHLRIDAA